MPFNDAFPAGVYFSCFGVRLIQRVRRRVGVSKRGRWRRRKDGERDGYRFFAVIPAFFSVVTAFFAVVTSFFAVVTVVLAVVAFFFSR